MVKRAASSLASPAKLTKSPDVKKVLKKSSEQATRAIQSDAQEQRLNRLALQRSRLNDLLDYREDIWADLILQIETGYYDKPEEASDNLHPSTNKWSLLSAEKLAEALIFLGLPDFSQMLTKAELIKLAAFLNHVEPGCALPSKHWPTIKDWMKARRDEVTSDLWRGVLEKKDEIADLIDGETGQLNYHSIGHFRLADFDGKVYKSVMHPWAGKRSIEGAEVGTGWSLSGNHHLKQAKLSKGWTTIPLRDLYLDEQGVSALREPDFMSEVGMPGRPKRAAAVKAKAKGRARGLLKMAKTNSMMIVVPRENDASALLATGSGGAV